MAAYAYQAFGKRVLSERPLSLLYPLVDSTPARLDDIHVQWSDESVDVDGPAVCGHPLSAIHGVIAPGGLWAILPGTGSVAWVPDDGFTLTIHPHATQTASKKIDGRRDTDSLVTGLLSRLPDKWGALPLHTAALLTPRGVVLITGVSGAGKSTISQTLQREFGWKILDDDSCAAVLRDGHVAVTPLGGIPRMRGDAAQSMNLQGAAIPGYHGQKISLPAENNGDGGSPAVAENGYAVLGVVSLNPSEDDEFNGVARITRIVGDESFLAVSGAAVALNRYAPSWRQKRFSVVAALCQGPVCEASYIPGKALPLDVARLIENNFSTAALAGLG